jgi:uncharacterized repeat protein (TIGR03803 family)
MIKAFPRSALAAILVAISAGSGPTAYRADASLDPEIILYRFQGIGSGDGMSPSRTLLADEDGALYGTTAFGGSGYGTVFKLSPDQSGYRETVIYRFNGIAAGDGANPYSLLIADGTGALYGTTANGGSTSFAAQGGGVVFKLTPAGHGYTESVLYRFQGGTYNDGAVPVAGLMFDLIGDLYGTTELGGSLAAGDLGQGGGAVFELTPTQTGYSESIPYEFQGPANGDGYFPQCALIADRNGNLYGTTSFGGLNGDGIVFKLSQTTGKYSESILYTFVGAPGKDGAQPYSSLIAGRYGSMSGTTLNGGTGYGAVFRITP